MSNSYSPEYRKKTKFEIAGKIDYHEQLIAASKDKGSLLEEDRKVLIIHAGGTIGMFKDENGKFEPKKDRFKTFLQNYPYFRDESETYFIGCDGFTITPQTIFKRKIWYKLLELEKLIDSTNMNITRLNTILKTIQQHYDNYDAFIILHGTDTMSFTASALSFMIQNLKKTVILTGAQVPIGQTRNDAINNLLCSLVIAGHYKIPEVLLLFDNTLMRGNRTSKTSVSSFHSFSSTNCYPIGKLGLKIDIKWELVRSCKADKPTVFRTIKEDSLVSVLRLTPFGVPPKMNTKYLVVESYGVGNIPTEGPFYEFLLENSKKEAEERTVIVNISQVTQSVILNIYATGHMALKLGLIPGSDMTCEAAVSKLSYLASLGFTYQEIKKYMAQNLRGELTELEDRQSMRKENYVVSCTTMLEKNFSNQSERFRELLLYNVLTNLICERSSHASLSELCASNQIDLTYRFPDKGTLLHQYAKYREKHSQPETYLKFLLQCDSLPINAEDQNECTALFYALDNNHLIEADILRNKGAEVKTSVKRVFRAIRDGQIRLLQLMCEYGDLMLYTNKEKRGVFTYAALQKKQQIFQLFRDNLPHDQDSTYLHTKDIYGKTAKDYIENNNWILDE